MEISKEFLFLVPIVLGLVQTAKVSGLNTRYAPAIALALGVLGTFLVGQFDILQGLVIGLTASGLFSGTKATVS